MTRNSLTVPIITTAAFSLASGAALGGAHTWDVNEVFSNPDGTIQFIELRECCGGSGEVNLNGNQVVSAATGMAFTFPSNLTPPSTNKHILLATQGFADLPGAPTPDHIIPDNFFDPDGDTLSYHTYDSWVISAGAVPDDCVSSLDRNSGAGLNTPTNYAGDTGEIDAWSGRVADLNDDGVVDTADLGALIGQFGTAGPEADLNEDGVVDTADLGALIGAFGTSCQ